MYIRIDYDVCMRRTTIEIDEELLARAQRALGQPTIRATVEEALRRAATTAEHEHHRRAARQRAYLAALGEHADLDVLGAEDMWR